MLWRGTMLLPGVIAVEDAAYSDPTFYAADKCDLAPGGGGGGPVLPVGAGTYYQGPMSTLGAHMARAWKQRGLLEAEIVGSVLVGSPFLCTPGSGGLTAPIEFSITHTIDDPAELSYGLWHVLQPGANHANSIGRGYAFSNSPFAQQLLNPDTLFSLAGCNSGGNCATAAVLAGASLDWLMPFDAVLSPGSPNVIVPSVGTIIGTPSGGGGPVTYSVDCHLYVSCYANGACPVISGGNHYMICYVGIAALLIIKSGDPTATYAPDVSSGFGDLGAFPPHSGGCPSSGYGQICGAAQCETQYDPSIDPFTSVTIQGTAPDDASFSAQIGNTNPSGTSIPAGIGGGGAGVLQWTLSTATFASPARFISAAGI